MEKSKASTESPDESTDDTPISEHDSMSDAEEETIELKKANGSGTSTDGSQCQDQQDQLDDLDPEKGQKGAPDIDKQSGTLIRFLAKSALTRTTPVAVSEGEHMDSVVGSIEPFPTSLARSSREPSQPGAYAEGGERISTPQFGENQINEPRHPLEVVDEANISPAETTEGLVEATPVESPIMASEPAEPVDHDRQQGNVMQQGPKTWNWIGCISAALIAVLLLFVSIVVLDNPSSVETPTPSTNTTKLSGEDDSVVTIVLSSGLQLNVPLELMNNTLQILENDMYATTPQVRAYKWAQNDPWLGNYSEEQLQQRFSLVTVYYSTNGNTSWRQVGGGMVSALYRNSTIEKKIEEYQVAPVVPAPSLGASNRPPGSGSGSGPPPGGLPPGIERVNVTSKAWLSYDDECEWFSSTFRATGNTICNEHGTMQTLSLKRNGLSGRIPEEIGMLTNLKAVHLWKNQLNGPIVSQFGAMSNLMELNLVENALSGTIPKEIGKLSNSLRFFAAGGGPLTGSLPQELWQLSKMKILHVAHTEITGSLPLNLANHMPDLKVLVLHLNQLSGQLPTSLPTGLVALRAEDNGLTGSIPSEFGLLGSSLTKLLLSGNQLSGTFATEFGLLSTLFELSLDGNEQISGPLPSELGLLNETLVTLKLEGTLITGSIPSELCSVPRLTFDCSPGRLCGCDCPCAQL
ncbi:Leucine Rich Repeat [Seminavis robusta]|uniref:Leucine Rich Repeat n=1 Tax=Seminavis robusta TaxID=568900 RepID=A0A9N8EKU0_9STRA|nr:Leucine Rich Repeat [Seminavis robusta]|eukprot:Sro1146_g246280.1 Leucine Rich Repeat (690) ;mRNA; f:1663-3732